MEVRANIGMFKFGRTAEVRFLASLMGSEQSLPSENQNLAQGSIPFECTNGKLAFCSIVRLYRGSIMPGKRNAYCQSKVKNIRLYVQRAGGRYAGSVDS